MKNTSSPTGDSLRRSSTTRRSLINHGGNILPPQRARSEERNVPEPDELLVGDDDGGGGGVVAVIEEEKQHQWQADVCETVGLKGGDASSSSPLRFVRCDSDYLDSAGDDTTTTITEVAQRNNGRDIHNHHNQTTSSPTHATTLPTLPRYPVLSTKNKNCWSTPPSTTFKIRSIHYHDTKKKITSGPYIFESRGADLIVTNELSSQTTDLASNTSVFAGHVRSVPTFIVNFVFPWGVLVNYYEIPELYTSFMQMKYELGKEIVQESLECFAPHERSVIRFLTGDDVHRNETFKLIPVCIEGPWVVKKMVSGQPALIGKRLPVSYAYHAGDHSRGLAPCFEADLDISASDSVGKKVVNLCRRYMNAVTVDIGLVIEGNCEEELPEQMLGCVRLHKLDALLAPTLPPP
eukprot:g10779.t1 g10779   contig4:2550626-2551843(+)